MIDFGQHQLFTDIVEKIKKLKNLKILIVANNVNTQDKQYDQIIAGMPSLESFNYEKAEGYRRMVLDQGALSDNNKKDKSKKAKQHKVDKK